MVDGFHATVFAYGQTGSGKTYTMEGYQYNTDPTLMRQPAISTKNFKPEVQPNDGVIPRAIHELFAQIKQKQAGNPNLIKVHVQYIQLYNEKVFDLLNSDHYKLATESKLAYGVPGLKIKVSANG